MRRMQRTQYWLHIAKKMNRWATRCTYNCPSRTGWLVWEGRYDDDSQVLISSFPLIYHRTGSFSRVCGQVNRVCENWVGRKEDDLVIGLERTQKASPCTVVTHHTQSSSSTATNFSIRRQQQFFYEELPVRVHGCNSNIRLRVVLLSGSQKNVVRKGWLSLRRISGLQYSPLLWSRELLTDRKTMWAREQIESDQTPQFLALVRIEQVCEDLVKIETHG